MLTVNPDCRLTAQEALNHPWLCFVQVSSHPSLDTHRGILLIHCSILVLNLFRSRRSTRSLREEDWRLLLSSYSSWLVLLFCLVFLRASSQLCGSFIISRSFTDSRSTSTYPHWKHTLTNTNMCGNWLMGVHSECMVTGWSGVSSRIERHSLKQILGLSRDCPLVDLFSICSMKIPSVGRPSLDVKTFLMYVFLNFKYQILYKIINHGHIFWLCSLWISAESTAPRFVVRNLVSLISHGVVVWGAWHCCLQS